MTSLKKLAREYHINHPDIFESVVWSQISPLKVFPINVEKELEIMKMFESYEDGLEFINENEGE